MWRVLVLHPGAWVLWVVRGWRAWAWCGGRPVGHLASDLKMAAPPCVVCLPFQLGISFWRLVCVVGRGALDWGNPRPTVVVTTSKMLPASFSFLKAATRFIFFLPDIPILGECPKPGFGWRHRSGVIPSLEAPPWDSGVVGRAWRCLVGSL
jgi:hypothetical protein